MNDRLKVLILKALMVICIILLFLLFPGCIIIGLLVSDESKVATILNTIIFSFLCFGILFILLQLIFSVSVLRQNPVKAERMPLAFATYDDLFCFLQISLLQKGYQMQKTVPFSPDGKVTVFVKSTGWWTLTCFTVVRVPELTGKLLEGAANDCVTAILSEYYKSKRITDTVNMISVFCVDRITPTLRNLVNGNIQQGFKNGRFPVGISLGGKNIYMAVQNDGYAIAKYKRMRKEFMSIMNL